MKNINNEIERIEKENAWNDSDEVVKLESSIKLDKVVPIRLSSEAWSKLRSEAKSLGVGPTTLARMWLLERLNSSFHSNMSDVFKNCSNDVFLHSSKSLPYFQKLLLLELILSYDNKHIASRLNTSENTLRRWINKLTEELDISTHNQHPHSEKISL